MWLINTSKYDLGSSLDRAKPISWYNVKLALTLIPVWLYCASNNKVRIVLSPNGDGKHSLTQNAPILHADALHFTMWTCTRPNYSAREYNEKTAANQFQQNGLRANKHELQTKKNLDIFVYKSIEKHSVCFLQYLWARPSIFIHKALFLPFSADGTPESVPSIQHYWLMLMANMEHYWRQHTFSSPEPINCPATQSCYTSQHI